MSPEVRQAFSYCLFRHVLAGAIPCQMARSLLCMFCSVNLLMPCLLLAAGLWLQHLQGLWSSCRKCALPLCARQSDA